MISLRPSMKCKHLYLYFKSVNTNKMNSERGTRREPSLLPEDYCGSVSDEGCL